VTRTTSTAQSKRPQFVTIVADSAPHPSDQRRYPAALKPKRDPYQKKRRGNLTNKNHRLHIACLLPAAAEGFVELNETLVFIVSCFRESEFSLK
jgi:hypothetical protein